MKEALLLDETRPVLTRGAEGDRRHQRQKGLAGGQGPLIGQKHEVLAVLRRKGGPCSLPLSQPFALGRGVEGHDSHPPVDRSLSHACHGHDIRARPVHQVRGGVDVGMGMRRSHLPYQARRVVIHSRRKGSVNRYSPSVLTSTCSFTSRRSEVCTEE